MLLSLLHINIANTSVMPNSNHITIQFAYLQDQKSLTLHQRSFPFIVHSTSAAIDNYIHNDLNVLVAFLTD